MSTSWSQTTEHRSTSSPQAGQYWLKSVSVNMSSSPAGNYYPNGEYSEGGPPSGTPYPQGHAVLTVILPSGETFSAAATQVGGRSDVQVSPNHWDVHGTSSETVTVNVDRIVTSGTASVEISGGAVGNLDDINGVWDWAFANITFNYVDGHSSSHTNCQYGTTVYDSHTISHLTNYHGNGGTPNLQTRDQSYTASGSKTITSSDCAAYPGYVSVSVPGQTKTFLRQGDGIVLPTLEDYFFEGWWGVESSRSSRGAEWTDGKDLGQYGTYDCYAHYMSSPVWERKNGAWHKWTPSDMNAQSVVGPITVNNIRSKHSDGTWPLDKPIYRRENGSWVQVKGAMIPPEGS